MAARLQFASRTNAFKANPVVAPRISRGPVKVNAFLGGLFGGKKEEAATGAAPKPMICVDCGWIYDGKTEFAKLPGSYKCPVCSSPKNRFKAYKGAVGGKINNTGSALAQRMKKREW